MIQSILRKTYVAVLTALGVMAASALSAAAQQPSPMPPQAPSAGPQVFEVQLAPGNDPKSGRLIVVATPATSVRTSAGQPPPSFIGPGGDSYIAAQEAPLLTPAQPTRFDADMLAFPRPLSRITPGEYWVQVRLDVNQNAAYGSMLDPLNDFTSTPVKMMLPTSAPARVTLTLERHVMFPDTAGQPLPALPAGAQTCNGNRIVLNEASKANLKPIDFASASLSEFWGRPIHICGWVLLPPGYETSRDRHPAVYRTEGFGATLATQIDAATQQFELMKSGQTPPMIRVFLDHSSPWGTHEFADSVNNGPWGKALTQELIPALEKQYRMDAKPSGRFVTGHSSGGWFAMWQIVRYPDVYGGAWARAPDPVDFRSFTGVDIYAASANAYVRPDGSAQYLVRNPAGQETRSLREYAQQENVLAEISGQFDSFDWVFSPRGNDGRPQPLFDRMTGRINPDVAAYWREYFDISAIIRRDWTKLRPKLDGKIHVFMGDNDTFHLNEAAHLLQDEMTKLGAKATFTFLPGGTHFNLDVLTAPGDAMGLEKKIAWEMWAVARPGSKLKPPATKN